MIRVQQVESKAALTAFIDFPHSLYKGDDNYVPELFIAQRDLLTPGKHPFHEHSTVQLFLAYDGNNLKGRIAAILNRNHNAFKAANDGFFGFFESVNEVTVARALIQEAAKWLIDQDVTNIIGPVNPTTNDPSGLLIEGFNEPPVAMMTYNKSYYQALLEDCGLVKKTDLLAYHLSSSDVEKKSVHLKDALLKRLESRHIVIRQINMKDFDNEVSKVLEVYNAAWEKNTGFVPMTTAEFRYLAKDLKMVLDKDFCLLAEHAGKVIGFALAIPDINQVLRKVSRGRLFPTGIFKLLFGLKKINYLRILALGVNEEYRKMGIEACFYASIIQKANAKKIKGGEASWILENNEMMNKGLLALNARVYKKYRIFQQSLYPLLYNFQQFESVTSH